MSALLNRANSPITSEQFPVWIRPLGGMLRVNVKQLADCEWLRSQLVSRLFECTDIESINDLSSFRCSMFSPLSENAENLIRSTARAQIQNNPA